MTANAELLNRCVPHKLRISSVFLGELDTGVDVPVPDLSEDVDSTRNKCVCAGCVFTLRSKPTALA